MNNKYIDLHIHLDGAITIDIARKLATLQNIQLPEEDDNLLKLLSVPPGCQSLNDFLKCFELPLTLLQTREAITQAVYLVSETMRKQGVIYAEIRFAPQLHTERGLSQENAITAAEEGLKKCKIPCNLILCLMRGTDNQEENMETVELAKKHLVENAGVVAIDLAGAESLYPTEDFKDLFAMANRYHIPFTIHAGEAAGADSIRAAIQAGARRIGHGVRLKEDEELLKMVVEKGIALEMCPTSNRQTKALVDMKDYPLVQYLQRGIKVTLNTDDPAISRTTLPEEFSYMKELLGLTKEQELQLLKNAIEVAFTDDETRKLLQKQLEGKTEE